MINARVRWAGNRQFIGMGENSGHAIVMDIPKDSGGEDSGLRATELLLISVAGCTAVDMVNILTKMRVKLRSCEVAIEGRQQEDYPKYFNRMKLKYTLSGEGLTSKKAQKALDLSMNKFCAISQTVKGQAEIETEIEIV